MCLRRHFGLSRAGTTMARSLAFGANTPPHFRFARLGKGVAYPTLKLSQPLFMATGEKDLDVSAEQQIALARDACRAGSRVEQHVYPGLDHSGTVNASLVDSVPFVRRVLAGQDIASTCAAAP